MKKCFLYFLISCLMCSCLHDDYKEDVLQNILYNGIDRRLFHYDIISESQKQMVWNEEFDNNDSKWPFDISKAHEIYDKYHPQYYTTATIKDGCLQVSTTMPFSMDRFFEIPVIFYEDKNYEIELSIFGDSGYSVYWDENWEEHYYLNIISLSFNNDGIKENAHLEKRVEEDGEKIRLWGSNRIVSGLFYYTHAKDFWFQNQFNAITVRKINDKYSFFINHKFFYLSDNNYKCILQTIQLWINNKNSRIDYVRVSYIP